MNLMRKLFLYPEVALRILLAARLGIITDSVASISPFVISRAGCITLTLKARNDFMWLAGPDAKQLLNHFITSSQAGTAEPGDLDIDYILIAFS